MIFYHSSFYLMLMRNCLAGRAPVYLMELCVPASYLPGRRSLRSAEQGDLVVPRVRLATAQGRSFAVVGWCCWAGPALTPGATSMRSIGNSAPTGFWIPCTSGSTEWDSIILSWPRFSPTSNTFHL